VRRKRFRFVRSHSGARGAKFEAAVLAGRIYHKELKGHKEGKRGLSPRTVCLSSLIFVLFVIFVVIPPCCSDHADERSAGGHGTSARKSRRGESGTRPAAASIRSCSTLTNEAEPQTSKARTILGKIGPLECLAALRPRLVRGFGFAKPRAIGPSIG